MHAGCIGQPVSRKWIVMDKTLTLEHYTCNKVFVSRMQPHVFGLNGRYSTQPSTLRIIDQRGSRLVACFPRIQWA